VGGFGRSLFVRLAEMQDMNLVFAGVLASGFIRCSCLWAETVKYFLDSKSRILVEHTHLAFELSASVLNSFLSISSHVCL